MWIGAVGTLALSGVAGDARASGWTVGAGSTLTVNGSVGGDIVVAGGATLAGGGNVGSLTLASGATLAPSPAVGFNVVGTVSLGGATLNLALGSAPTSGTVYTLIGNDGRDAVSGTFAGLAEGATYTAGTASLRISYAGGDGNDVTLTALATAPTAPTVPPGGSPTVVVTPPVSTSASAPLIVTIPGITAPPTLTNMAAGAAPSFLDDLIAMLSAAVGQPLRYVEQNALGVIILGGYHGGSLVFVPSNFQGGGDARVNGIYVVGDGSYQVVRNGQSLVIAPALVRLDQLLSLFPGVSATLGDNGVITATVNGVTYVVQPGVAVQLDPATGSARTVMGSDGYWHFIDMLGNNQILYPAFADVTALRNALQALDPAATVSIQLDGTAAIMLKGQPYTLVPDLTLSQVPAERVGQGAWGQESATRFWVLNNQPLGTAQGFTVRP